MKHYIVKFLSTVGDIFVTNGKTSNDFPNIDYVWDSIKKSFNEISNPDTRFTKKSANIEILEIFEDFNMVTELVENYANLHNAVGIVKDFTTHPVSVFDKSGKLVYKFPTILDASEFTGLTVKKIRFFANTGKPFENLFFKLKNHRKPTTRKVFVYDINFENIFSGNSFEAAQFIGANSITTINGAIYKPYLVFEKYFILDHEITKNDEAIFEKILTEINSKKLENDAKELERIEQKLAKKPFHYVYDETKKLVYETRESAELSKMFKCSQTTIRVLFFNNKKELKRKHKGFYLSKTLFN